MKVLNDRTNLAMGDIDEIRKSARECSSRSLYFSNEDVTSNERKENEFLSLQLLSSTINVASHNSNSTPPEIYNSSENYHTPKRHSKSDSRTFSINLDALKSHTPFESEAEYYIQSTLDEKETGEKSSSHSKKTQSRFSIRTSDDEIRSEIDRKRSPKSVFTDMGGVGTSKITNLVQKLGRSRESNKSGCVQNHVETNSSTLFSNASAIMKYIPSNEVGVDDLDEIPVTDRLSSVKGHFDKMVHATKEERSKIFNNHDDTDNESNNYQKGKHYAGSEEYQSFYDWLRIEKMGIMQVFQCALAYIMLPSLVFASILFYAFDNPPCQNPDDCVDKNAPKHTDESMAEYFSQASMSWWFIFLGCRQVVTFLLGKFTEDVLVDYFALRTSWSVRIFGPLFTLFIVQSKGWPCTTFFWGIFDLCMLFGKHKFAQHWLYYQNLIGLMNEQNPSGNVPDSDIYKACVIFFMLLAFVVAAKRVWLGLKLGCVTFSRYSEELKKVMARAKMVGKVASLAVDIERSNHRFNDNDLPSASHFISAEGDDNDTEIDSVNRVSARFHRNLFAGMDESLVKAKISDLLGEWEEPDLRHECNENPTIWDIILFRKHTAYLNTKMPFGAEFGTAASRAGVVETIEEIYNRLMLSIPQRKTLSFDVLALLAVQKDGSLDITMLMQLIKLFRPDRDGNLSLLDFAKSIDLIYKELRLLRANIHNSSKMDRSFEGFFDFFFYLFVLFVFLAVIGVNPMVLFATVTSIIISFSFIIKDSCQNFLNGFLMIYFRRPYDIGDRIAVILPYYDSLTTGSLGWIVQDIDLFTTTVVYGSSNEVATYQNSAMYTNRIINQTRSPLASLFFTLQFGIDTPFEKVQVFKTALEKFVKARPREWARFAAFRTYSVEANLGYVEYYIGVIHRESWHNSLAICNSKSELEAFANELAKKMKMCYKSPVTPVEVTFKNTVPDAIHLPVLDTETTLVSNSAERSEMIRNVAKMFGTSL